jgi:hypothetical protein
MLPFMKPNLSFCLILFSVAALGVASDLIIEQEVEAEGAKFSMLMQVKGSQARMDMGNESSVILDLESGDMTTIMHGQKMVMTMSGDQLQSMTQMAAHQSDTSEPGELVPTGKTEVINGFNTAQYLSKGNETDAEYWIAEDLPNAKMLTRRFASLSETLNKNSPAPSLAMDPDKFPGFPIRTIIKTEDGQRVVSTISRIEEALVPASVFEIPADYQSMRMPNIPMGDLNFGR